MISNTIFDKVLSAYREKDVVPILKAINSNVSWLPVGQIPNNLGIIDMLSDPAAGLTERITNAIDAVLEKKWLEQGKPRDIKSPREAVEKWFGIPDGHLAKIENPSHEVLKNLSNLVTVSLHDSDKKKKPTIEIRDQGLGIEAKNFKHTILGLNGSNKLEKFHLMGAFGQGGSTSLAFSNYTIIISKYIGNKKEAAFTIVRCNQDATKKNAWYEYMIDKLTGIPFVVEVDEKRFEVGTLVRHILMDIDKYKGPITTSNKSLFYLAHHYLFDPVIPFVIEDKRSSNDQEKRQVVGNNRRLTYAKDIVYRQESPLLFEGKKLKIYYWVLNTSGESSRKTITNYTNDSDPIIVTLNGQKQGSFKSYWFKKLKLPYLERYLIVQVEADDLDLLTRRKLFTSNRESLKKTEIGKKLEEELLYALRQDDNLNHLNDEIEKEFLTKSDTEVTQTLQKRLAKRISQYLQTAGSNNPPTTTSEAASAMLSKDPVPVQDPPTLLDILIESPKHIVANRQFWVKFKTDAHENYFSNPNTFSVCLSPKTLGVFTGTSNLVIGYGRACFRASQDAKVGEQGKVTLTLKPLGDQPISTSIDVEVVLPPGDANPEKKGTKNAPNIKPVAVDENHEFYKKFEWNKESTAKVQATQEAITVYVNTVNKHLKKLMDQATKHGEEAMERIKYKYIEHVAFHAFVSEQNMENASKKNEKIEIIDEVRDVELKSAIETICGLLDDLLSKAST